MKSHFLCTIFFLTNFTITPSSIDKPEEQIYCQSPIPLCGFLGKNKNGDTSLHSGILIDDRTALTVGPVPIESTVVFSANGPVQTHKNNKLLPFIDIIEQVRDRSSTIIESLPFSDEPYEIPKAAGKHLSSVIRMFGIGNVFIYRLHTGLGERAPLPQTFNVDLVNEEVFSKNIKLDTFTYGFVPHQQNGNNHFWPAMIKQKFKHTVPLEVLASTGKINHGSLHGAPVFIRQENSFPLLGLRGWPITTKKPNKRFTYKNLLSRATDNNKLISTVHRINPNSLAAMLVRGLRTIIRR